MPFGTFLFKRVKTMSRYQVLDVNKVNQYIKDYNLHLKLHGKHQQKINIKKLHTLLLTHNNEMNNQIRLFFNEHKSAFHNVLSSPMGFDDAILLSAVGYVPELRHKYHVHYFAKNNNYYFIFHNANLHSKDYWKNLTKNCLNSQQIPIYQHYFWTHKLKSYMLNFAQMCYSTKSLVRFCPINTFDINKAHHSLIYMKNNSSQQIKVSNKDLIQAKIISVGQNKDIAVYTIKGKHIIIKSRKLIRIKQKKDVKNAK